LVTSSSIWSSAQEHVSRDKRRQLNMMSAFPIGDILLYQAHGATIRDFIRRKIEAATPPVTLISHSLGGIACFDLMAAPDAPEIACLVTVGSQAPFLYEIGALHSLKRPQGLPDAFPRWLNIYDRNDFLSFAAHRLFEEAVDLSISSGQPFPDSHSAYFTNEAVWNAIRDFVVANG
jgi:pimeloyl-ACP methyl ester carboxylesterase